MNLGEFSRGGLKLALVGALALSGGCNLPGTKVKFSVNEGSQYCQVFQTPAPWVTVGPMMGGLLPDITYRWPADSRNAILISPGSFAEVDYSTKDKFTGRTLESSAYRVSLSIPVKLSPASPADWKAGVAATTWPAPAQTTYHSLQWPPGEESTKNIPDVAEGARDLRKYMSEGHELARSGNIWDTIMPVILSPSKSYVALQSWNGWSNRGRAPFSGDLFIDLYAVGARKRLARIKGSWNDFSPDGVFSRTVWLTKNDLILPFNWDERSFLLCHLP